MQRENNELEVRAAELFLVDLSTILYLVEGESGLGEVVQFGPKLAGLAGDTFLDRSRSSVGVGSSFFDMFQVWGFFFDFSFFVVSGSAEGSRKVPQIWPRSAGDRQIRQIAQITLWHRFGACRQPES